ncbi:MAG: hypothetical protein L3J74_06290 [Bacteroidales bacterium]|nr:hypothetical protein [Bacteroidales bacterium]
MMRIFIISLLLVSCIGNTNPKANTHVLSYQTQIKHVKQDTLLANIQSKIYNAFVQSLMSKNDTALLKLSLDLEKLHKTHKQNLISYWRSYLQFYLSIYYLKYGDKKAAEKEIDKGTEWMDALENKNSEDYALLSMLQGFRIQFKRMRAMFIANDMKENAKTALSLDTSNIRAYYVYASNDFHTPAKYGGGKEAEQYLLKAISLPTQKVKNEYLPSWGKEEAYELLVKLYIKKESWELAKKYFQDGIKQFPDSYLLNKLASQLVGK